MVLPFLCIALFATIFIIYWLVLLNQAVNEDWIAAAYNKVFDNRNAILKLKRKDAEKAALIHSYHGIAQKLLLLFLKSDSSKKIKKLEQDSEIVQRGNLKSVSLFVIPGYVLHRKYEKISRSTFHKNIMAICTELYGKKYAVNRSKHIIAQILSYPIIGMGVALALAAIGFGIDNQNAGIAFLAVGPMIVGIFSYVVYDEAADRLKKRRAAIARQFPNVVSKLALLVTSGMIMDRAWKETANSQEGELYDEMRHTSEELDHLVDSVTAYNNFLNRCNTKETTKLASAILQNSSKGNAEIGKLLKEMAHDAWQERRHTAKRDSEAANAKLIIPTMLLFIAILVMIMVPVAMNFSSL